MESLYVLPSLGALAAKILVLWLSVGRYRESSPWLWCYFASLFWLNLVEALGFAYFINHPDEAFPLFVSYYIALTSAGFALLIFSLEISGLMRAPTFKTVCVLWGVFCSFLVIPGLSIVSTEVMGFTLTAVRGPAYPLTILGILAPFAGAICLFVYTLMNAPSKPAQSIAGTMLLSTGAIILTLLVIAIGLALGVKANLTIIMSFATFISIVIIVSSKCTVMSLRSGKRPQQDSFIPSPDHLEELSMGIHRFAGPSLKESRKAFENAVIAKTVARFNGDKTAAARELGVSLSTVKRGIANYHSNQSTPLSRCQASYD